MAIADWKSAIQQVENQLCSVWIMHRRSVVSLSNDCNTIVTCTSYRAVVSLRRATARRADSDREPAAPLAFGGGFPSEVAASSPADSGRAPVLGRSATATA